MQDLISSFNRFLFNGKHYLLIVGSGAKPHLSEQLVMKSDIHYKFSGWPTCWNLMLEDG